MDDKKEKFKYTIDGIPGQSEDTIITEAELREVGSVPADYEVYQQVNGPGDDKLIKGSVELSKQPGKNKFYSSKPNTNNG